VTIAGESVRYHLCGRSGVAPHFMKSLDIVHARDGEVMLAYLMNGACSVEVHAGLFQGYVRQHRCHAQPACNIGCDLTRQSRRVGSRVGYLCTRQARGLLR
jgi:hypothetical protein